MLAACLGTGARLPAAADDSSLKVTEPIMATEKTSPLSACDPQICRKGAKSAVCLTGGLADASNAHPDTA